MSAPAVESTPSDNDLVETMTASNNLVLVTSTGVKTGITPDRQ